MTRFYEQLAAVLAENRPFVLALISGTKGSSPQRRGAKALFFPDGKMVGTLGGGCLEAEVHSRAKQAMQTGESSTFQMVLDHDFGWDDGLICGGSVSGLILPRAAEAAGLWRSLVAVTEPMRWGVKKDFSIGLVAPNELKHPLTASLSPGGGEGGVSPGEEGDWLYQETVAPPTDLWIAGSGHVAQAVVPLALQLNFAVTVFDDRPELANHQFFPSETTLRVGGWHELLKVPLPQSPVFGLVITRGHQHDALVLSEWI
ncbi:MAG TPA: XdhC family protein, partial [Verrucomicrobiae bacterium]|nr:XdhC family protein [Verrucomicrobiae bacterium]